MVIKKFLTNKCQCKWNFFFIITQACCCVGVGWSLPVGLLLFFFLFFELLFLLELFVGEVLLHALDHLFEAEAHEELGVVGVRQEVDVLLRRFGELDLRERLFELAAHQLRHVGLVGGRGFFGLGGLRGRRWWREWWGGRELLRYRCWRYETLNKKKVFFEFLNFQSFFSIVIQFFDLLKKFWVKWIFWSKSKFYIYFMISVKFKKSTFFLSIRSFFFR